VPDRAGERAVGSLHRAAFENCLHWIELCATRGGNREGSTERAGDFYEGAVCLCGAFDDLVIPKNSQKTDWEVGIGAGDRQASLVLFSEAEALGHVAGYCLMNDYSERAFQIEREASG